MFAKNLAPWVLAPPPGLHADARRNEVLISTQAIEGVSVPGQLVHVPVVTPLDVVEVGPDRRSVDRFPALTGTEYRQVPEQNEALAIVLDADGTVPTAI